MVLQRALLGLIIFPAFVFTPSAEKTSPCFPVFHSQQDAEAVLQIFLLSVSTSLVVQVVQ